METGDSAHFLVGSLVASLCGDSARLLELTTNSMVTARVGVDGKIVDLRHSPPFWFEVHPEPEESFREARKTAIDIVEGRVPYMDAVFPVPL